MYNRQIKADIQYIYCAASWGYGEWFYRYYTIYQSYKCYDSYNNLVPTPSINGVSAVIAKNQTTSVSVTLKFKYTAAVGNSDECRIQYCRAFVSDGKGDTNWRNYPYDCPQGSGSSQTTQTVVTLSPNKESVPYYFYWIDVGSKSLPFNP